MQPYYTSKDGAITLWHGDCRDVLPSLSADVCITDPPYSQVTHLGARALSARRDALHELDTVRSLVTFDALTDTEVVAIFEQIAAVTARWVVSFMDWRHIAAVEAIPPAGLRFVRFGIWHKPDGAPQFTGDRPATGWEGIAILHRLGGRMRWNGGGHHAFWSYPVARGLHETQKPLGLVRELVRLFSDPNERVVDPFAGSGTTLVAALSMGRRAIGIEKSEAHCETAARRLESGDQAAARPNQGILL